LRETRREMGRRELKPTYLELPPLSKGAKETPRSSQQDYFERRLWLVKLILIKGVKSDQNRQLAPVKG
jgi:hypothetical protein